MAKGICIECFSAVTHRIDPQIMSRQLITARKRSSLLPRINLDFISQIILHAIGMIWLVAC